MCGISYRAISRRSSLRRSRASSLSFATSPLFRQAHVDHAIGEGLSQHQTKVYSYHAQPSGQPQPRSVTEMPISALPPLIISDVQEEVEAGSRTQEETLFQRTPGDAGTGELVLGVPAGAARAADVVELVKGNGLRRAPALAEVGFYSQNSVGALRQKKTDLDLQAIFPQPGQRRIRCCGGALPGWCACGLRRPRSGYSATSSNCYPPGCSGETSLSYLIDDSKNNMKSFRGLLLFRLPL